MWVFFFSFFGIYALFSTKLLRFFKRQFADGPLENVSSFNRDTPCRLLLELSWESPWGQLSLYSLDWGLMYWKRQLFLTRKSKMSKAKIVRKCGKSLAYGHRRWSPLTFKVTYYTHTHTHTHTNTFKKVKIKATFNLIITTIRKRWQKHYMFPDSSSFY
jgi:hypothetical protein